MNVEVRQSKSRWPRKRPQRWYVVIKAANGSVLFTSEMYTNRSYTEGLAMSVRGWFA